MTTILSDGSVEFRFFRPQASRVSIAGTFNAWRDGATPMRRLPGGWWRAVLELPEGDHQFRYVADGQWFTDYAAHGIEPNRHGCNSLLVIGARRRAAA